MKMLLPIVMMSSLVGLSVSANAAPQNLLNNSSLETASQPSQQPREPLNLLARVREQTCDSAQSTKVCDVRIAAARRAAEVVAGETPSETRSAAPAAASMGLLIPVGFVPVSAVPCAPGLTLKECERLNEQNPGVPLGPKEPTLPAIPESPTPPVAADPESVIKPPRTGDTDLVKRPPATGSQMPVIVPKAEPPVIQ